jgi:Holliday junction resolvase RusA-like endonuclease
MDVIELRLTGQIHGGKNQILHTRSGHRYPNKLFAQWSKAAIAEIIRQKPLWTTLCTPYLEDATLHWQFIYTPSDRRRRDVPAILDAVFHVLERADVVSDDAIIKNLTFTTLPPDKDNAGMTIRIEG